MNKAELAKKMQNALATYGSNKPSGNNYINSFRNANAALSELNSINETTPLGGEYKAWKANLNNQKANAAIDAGTSSLLALGNMYGNFEAASDIDTPAQEEDIRELRNAGSGNYGNYSQLISDFGNTDFSIDTDYDSIRNMTKIEKAANVASSVGSGASAGLAIGGPWGAAIGGAVGLAAGLGGIFAGDKAAKEKESVLNAQAQQAEKIALANFEAAGERIADRDYRSGVANAAAKGGKIHIDKSKKGTFTAAAKRNHMSVQQFAKHVLAAKNKGKYSPSMRKKANFARNASHWHGKGGTVVRIKK